MIIYHQSTGKLLEDNELAGAGYSGHGPGLNNPEMEACVGLGPIPAGKWKIGPWFYSNHLGPCVAELTPVGHSAHGRSGFYIHGDNTHCDHSGSEGCIVLNHAIRTQLKANGQHDLLVVR